MSTLDSSIQQHALRKLPYTYKPLNPRRIQIRLVHVLPGKALEQISVRLEIVDFEDFLEYEALSYVWGSENDPATIELFETDISATKGRKWNIRVTRNLEEALQHLRCTEKIRTMWIDAICINQGSLEERSQQVQLMTAIYRRAASVLCWLGPASHDSDLVMSCIREINSLVTYDEASDYVKAVNDRNEAHLWTHLGGDAPLSEEHVSALASLWSRPWFSRLWIWQEVHMGDKRSLLLCGRSEVTWYQFRAVVHACSGKQIYGRDHSAFVLRLESLLTLCERSKQTQLYQLDSMRLSDCKQPSDRIYTSQALATFPGFTVYLEPDYQKSHQEVFLEWATKYVQQQSDLELLLHLAPLDISASLPSWVPDWSRKRPTTIRFIFGIAHGGAQSAVTSVDNKRLTVKGVFVTTIKHVVPSDLTMRMTSTKARGACLSRLAAAVLAFGQSNELARLAKVLCRGLINDIFQPPDPRRRFLSSLASTLEHIIDDPSTDFDDPTMIPPSVIHDVAEMTNFAAGRSIFVTETNQLGLGHPSLCRETDVVAVLLGCKAPLVLRPSHDGTYQVLGEAYVEDLSAGEAILGPVPFPYEFIWSWKDGYLDSAFRNAETGDVTYVDPRLPPLPEEWEDITDPDRPWNIRFKHRETSETQRGQMADPRCDVEALEARGVKLQDFTLM